jgi:hypothetical protein
MRENRIKYDRQRNDSILPMPINLALMYVSNAEVLNESSPQFVQLLYGFMGSVNIQNNKVIKQVEDEAFKGLESLPTQALFNIATAHTQSYRRGIPERMNVVCDLLNERKVYEVRLNQCISFIDQCLFNNILLNEDFVHKTLLAFQNEYIIQATSGKLSIDKTVNIDEVKSKEVFEYIIGNNQV